MNHFVLKSKIMADVFCKNNIKNILKIHCIKETYGEIEKTEVVYKDGQFINISDKTQIKDYMYDQIEFEILLSELDYQANILHHITYETPTLINLKDFDVGDYLIKYVCETSSNVKADVMHVNLTSNKSKIGAIGSSFTFDLNYKILCAYKIG